MLCCLSVSAGVNNPHSALWPHISDGILPSSQQTETDIQHATQDAALVKGISFDPLVIVSDFELVMVQPSGLELQLGHGYTV